MNLMTSYLSSIKSQIILAIVMMGIGLGSCQEDELIIPVNVGTVRFVSNAYTIENNTVDPLTVTLPFSLAIEEDAVVKISVDDQSTLLSGEYTITPEIPEDGLTIKVPKGSTELSFNVSSLNNFDGERSLILKIESATGGLLVANVDASTSITVKGNPIINPEVRTSQQDIAFGSVITNTTSASKTYVLTGVKLTTDVLITASANFEVSLDDDTYASTLTIPFEAANLSPISIYARAVANTGTNQTLSGTITHVSGTLPVANINLSAVEYGNAAPGVLLKSENFNYTSPGALLTASGAAWKGFSGIGANPIQYISTGLTYTGYSGSNIGGALSMQNYQPSAEDASLDFPEQTSGVIYVAQMINMASAPTSADFFASLGNGAAGTTPLYYNRIYAKASGSQYSLGLSRNASTSPVYFATNLDYGKTYLVVTKYEFVTNSSSMYVLTGAIPSAEPPISSAASSGGAADPSSMTRMVIRQSTGRPLEATIDGYRVATSWKEAVGL